MKKKILIFTAALGVFLMIDTSLLAQTTGTSSERSSSRSSSRATVVVPAVPAMPAMPDIEDIEIAGFDNSFYYGTTSSDKNSKLTLSKRYEGTTATKKGTFKVEEGVRKIRLSVSGRVESGKINVELYLPNKKESGKFLIDNSADVHWSQTINIEEEESKYIGEWTFVINVEEAHGSYVLSLSTY